ncbi:hypothetical protein PAXRUDRAFT_271870 [Paxillus rubicundulus Ve08.2h10]|uniref:Uncharacterized protein n=1 Tax=Paxillus rubicundulus Ve08.2h10 TaxID=930991 RepID=A0A0D0E614_9AGAM|nr:hypothetical protein PAXRUDRAFT_271870 [Paxillus rubicundulus Ve08.2h10]
MRARKESLIPNPMFFGVRHWHPACTSIGCFRHSIGYECPLFSIPTSKAPRGDQGLAYDQFVSFQPNGPTHNGLIDARVVNAETNGFWALLARVYLLLEPYPLHHIPVIFFAANSWQDELRFTGHLTLLSVNSLSEEAVRKASSNWTDCHALTFRVPTLKVPKRMAWTH